MAKAGKRRISLCNDTFTHYLFKPMRFQSRIKCASQMPKTLPASNLDRRQDTPVYGDTVATVKYLPIQGGFSPYQKHRLPLIIDNTAASQYAAPLSMSPTLSSTVDQNTPGHGTISATLWWIPVRLGPALQQFTEQTPATMVWYAGRIQPQQLVSQHRIS